MRAEDQLKVVDEEEAEEILQGLDEGRDDEEAEAKAIEELPSAAHHLQQVLAAMREVLNGSDVVLEQVGDLSRDEREALEVLKQVVHGRGERGNFIYAEQRLEQLNQVLAVLQPSLSIASVPGVEVLRDELTSVIDQVDELRQELIALDGAEEEAEEKAEEQAEESDADKDDDDGPEEKEKGKKVWGKRARRKKAPPAAKKPVPAGEPVSVLADGPEAPEKTSGPTTLTGGPEAPAVQPRPSTLATGPEAPALPVRPTTLVGGPEAPAVEPRPSTLVGGPEAPAVEPRPSTLVEK